jgi:hypothetical protein
MLTTAFLCDLRLIAEKPERILEYTLKLIQHEPAPPERLIAAAKATQSWKESLPSTLEVDVADLRRVLLSTALEVGKREVYLKDYTALRTDQLSKWEDWEQCSLPKGFKLSEDGVNVPNWIRSSKWPVEIPLEFRLYAEGVERLHDHGYAKARESWQSLLILPLEQRRNRSAWAAWMMMKTATTSEDTQHWLKEVCRLIADEACLDSLRMMPAALALLSKKQADPASLETLSLHYYNTKANERSVYSQVLDDVALTIANDSSSDLRKRASRDPASREIITSILASFAGGVDPKREQLLRDWALELDVSHVQDDALIGTFGIALYYSQQYDLARKFLAHGDRNWKTLWIQSKLDLQHGDSSAATKHIGEALRLFPESERQHIVSLTESYYDRHEYQMPENTDWRAGLRNSRFLAECAAIRLTSDDLSTALKLFLEAGCPHDAAYVAEHLMTTDEVLSFMRKYKLAVIPEKSDEGKKHEEEMWFHWHDARTENLQNRLLYVIARKLAREQYFKDARPLFPKDILPYFDRYVVLIRRAHNHAMSNEVRASCLMEAARLHRWMGMELFGAEGEPDASVWEGSYPYENITLIRESATRGMEGGHNWVANKWGWVEKKANDPFPLRPSLEEVKRMKQNMLWGRPRFHYRYVAAQMAREAAHLLSRDSNEAAAMLAEGALWVPTIEDGIDPMFEELINRFAKTPLGSSADKVRWIPRNFIEEHNEWDAAKSLKSAIPGD